MVDLADQLEQDLPFLRRYSRALTGSQAAGDALDFDVLKGVHANREVLRDDQTVQINLFRLLHAQRTRGEHGMMPRGVEPKAAARLSAMSENLREAVLLSTLERLDADKIGTILDLDGDAVQALLSQAPKVMEQIGTAAILIIEDDSLIVEDLRSIVTSVGHTVGGVARTHTEATQAAQDTQPDVILADIELADGSSGVAAVTEILDAAGSVPIIFVTAYPERLLTGHRPEPAFLITKPYTGPDVTAAIAQAMFFASTGPLPASG